MSVMKWCENVYDNHPFWGIAGILAFIGALVLWASNCPSEKTPLTPGETDHQATMEQALRVAKPGDLAVNRDGKVCVLGILGYGSPASVIVEERAVLNTCSLYSGNHNFTPVSEFAAGVVAVVSPSGGSYGRLAECFFLGRGVTVDGPPSARFSCGE